MTTKYPFYLRSTVILLGLILFVFVLSQLGDILIPFCFATMLAILLNPLCNWLQKKKVPKTLSISLCLLAATLVFGCIAYFVVTQMASFTTEMPLLKKKCIELFAKLQQLINQKVGINLQKQNQWLTQAQEGLKPFAGSAISGMFGVLSMLFLLPVMHSFYFSIKSLLSILFMKFLPTKIPRKCKQCFQKQKVLCKATCLAC